MDSIDEFLQRFREPSVRLYLCRRLKWGESYIRHFEGRRIKKTSETRITVVENSLGIRFPPSYRKLLRTCDAEEIRLVADVLWVGKCEGPYLDLLFVNREGRLPDFLIAVTNPGNGDLECFDLRYPDERGEYPIILWDHEIHDSEEITPNHKFHVVAKDLGEFLLRGLPKQSSG